MSNEGEHDLRLREFVESDESTVNTWFSDAGELRFFAGPRLIWPLDAGQWRSIRLDQSVTSWTAVRGDSDVPVGHGDLVAESPSTVRLARLAIAPSDRGKGLGRALVRSLIAKSREGGYTLVALNVHQDNSTAIRAYRSVGFEPAGTALAHASVRMELALA